MSIPLQNRPVTSIYRTDKTNVGDWFCAPKRYFDIPGPEIDILDADPAQLAGPIILGGGGLVAQTFRPHLERIAAARPRFGPLIAWGIGESLNVDRSGGFVMPYAGALPDYLGAFDLVGLRDFGTPYPWVPCVSCLLDQFDRPLAPATHEIVIYEHKRIPIPVGNFPRRNNDGNDIDATLAFLSSGEVVITNSYHGAYWATLLGRRVIAIPNMSKMYRLKHAPVIARAQNCLRLVDQAVHYPQALEECRKANKDFDMEVRALLAEYAA